MYVINFIVIVIVIERYEINENLISCATAPSEFFWVSFKLNLNSITRICLRRAGSLPPANSTLADSGAGSAPDKTGFLQFRAAAERGVRWPLASVRLALLSTLSTLKIF